MTRSLPLSFAALAFTIGAWAADGASPASPPPPNPFAIPGLDLSLVPNPSSVVEDFASPFVEQHDLEQVAFFRYYVARYDARAPLPPGKPPIDLPDDDAQGRPLWFDPPAAGFDLLDRLVLNLFMSEQFASLDRLFDDWNSPTQLRADGRWRLTEFDAAFRIYFAGGPAWDSSYQTLLRWREKNPTSRAAAIAEAIYWNAYAWNARGSGAASTVTDEGWALYSERLEKAAAALAGSKGYASSSPLWDYETILLARAVDRPIAERLELFAQATKKEKMFVAFYTATVEGLTPKWGGDWKLVDEFVRSAVAASKSSEGQSLYARLYDRIDECDCGGFDLLRDTLVTWPDLKRGFDDLIRLYPHSGWNLNRYAAYACIAKDREAYLSLRARIGEAAILAAWPHNHSLDLCDHTFPAQPL
jgi:hypothetical protein